MDERCQGLLVFSPSAGRPTSTVSLEGEEMKRYKHNFEFGDWVETEAYIEMGYDGFGTKDKLKRMLFRVKHYKTICGRICGMVYRYEGNIGADNIQILGYDYDYFEPDLPQSHLCNIKSRRLYQIKQGMMNKPILCLPEDLKKIPEQIQTDLNCVISFTKPHFPILWKTPEGNRQYLRDIMKNHPRDKKGRWIKK